MVASNEVLSQKRKSIFIFFLFFLVVLFFLHHRHHDGYHQKNKKRCEICLIRFFFSVKSNVCRSSLSTSISHMSCSFCFCSLFHISVTLRSYFTRFSLSPVTFKATASTKPWTTHITHVAIACRTRIFTSLIPCHTSNLDTNPSLSP